MTNGWQSLQKIVYGLIELPRAVRPILVVVEQLWSFGLAFATRTTDMSDTGDVWILRSGYNDVDRTSAVVP